MKLLKTLGMLLAIQWVPACVSQTPQRPVVGLHTGKNINTESYLAARRAFFRMKQDDALRSSLRARLIGYLGQGTQALIMAGQYEKVVEHFAEMTALYTSEELPKQSLSPELGPVARYLREHGSRRGDEARVLSALWILWRLHADDDEEAGFQKEYRQVARWGRQARISLPVIERYQDLIEVWEEHARLVPAPRVLSQLVRCYIARRQALDVMIGELGQKADPKAGVEEGFQDINLARFIVRRTPVDLAAVYMAQGDLRTAYAVLKKYGSQSEAEQQFMYLVALGLGKEPIASDAVLTLARLYIKDIGRMDVARGLCLRGRQNNPTDARFALCLARVAAMENEYADATAEYAEATRLATQERGIYDEALRVLQRLIETRAFETDPTHTRVLATEAEHVLRERMRRWPNIPPPVKLEQFYFAIGTAEMSAGNTGGAIARFEASLKAEPNIPSLLRLGLLSLNRGRTQDALKYYEQALTMARKTPGKALQVEGEALEKLGDTLRMASRSKEAQQRYQQAADTWRRASDQLRAESLAIAYVRRGVLAERLGNPKQSVEFFEQAMSYAAAERGVYEQILSYLVTSPVNAELAEEVYWRALRQVSLEPEWKVYFALWVQIIVGRSGNPVPKELVQELNQLVGSDAWWGRLASFGARKLPYANLLAEASERGEQAEAHFYEGARLMVEGNSAAATALFRRVLATDMVSFYEYAMAREFLVEPSKLRVPDVGSPAQRQP
jgi:tetratricopeptide (TPR) repeat protein